MVHTILIGVHAAAAVAAFVAGAAAVRWRGAARPHVAALVVMAVALLAAVVEEWGRLAPGTRLVFAGLLVLAAAVVAQGVRVLRATDVRRRWNALGFTLVSLFAAYVVIQVRGLGAPLWLILVAVAAASLLGHVVLRAATPAALRAGRRSTAAAR